MTGKEVAENRIRKQIVEHQGDEPDNSDLHDYEKGFLKGLKTALKILQGDTR